MVYGIVFILYMERVSIKVECIDKQNIATVLTDGLASSHVVFYVWNRPSTLAHTSNFACNHFKGHDNSILSHVQHVTQHYS